MSEQGRAPIPAGWYQDPQNPTQSRYWNGVAWAGYASPQASAPVGASPAGSGPALKAPAGTGWNTVWIWLIVLLPLLSTITLLFVPWGSLFDIDPRALVDAGRNPLVPYAGLPGAYAVFASPFYWVSVLLGWVIYGLSVFFAYRDHKQLAGWGVPSPFHWAWAFLNPVYVIARSVVVVRRTGHGWAPLWVLIAHYVLGFVVAGIISAIAFNSLADLMREIAIYSRS